MKLLLDTHVFIWLAAEPERMSSVARNAILSTENDLFLSIVSLWEMQIKIQLGKLQLDIPLFDFWSEQRRVNQISLLQVSESNIWRLESLIAIHRDPFDRLIIAQALDNNYTIITADTVIKQYQVDVLW